MNLKRRGNHFYVRRRVPAGLVDLLGRTEVVRTTGTGDLQEAKRRSFAILAEIEDEFQRVAALAHENPASPKWAQKIALELRLAVQRGELTEELARELWHDHIEKHLKTAGKDPDQLSDIHLLTLRAAGDMVTRPGMPFSSAVESYLGEKEGRVNRSTIGAKRRALTDLGDWLKADVLVSQINRQHAGAYVSHLLRNGRSLKTNRDTVSVLSAFWNWATRKGLTEANPWTGQAADLKEPKRGTAGDRRRPWKAEELEAYFKSLGADDVRWQAAAVALYTGMRLNEVCHLETSDVNLEEGFLAIPEGKTESSVRQVPIHPIIRPLIKRLVTDSKDGYLLSGLKPGGEDRKRGHGLSKRIGRYIRVNLELTDKGVVFHTLRNTFINACENAGIAQHTTELLVGHARQSMSYGLYSPGPSLPTLQTAMRKVHHGQADKIIKNALRRKT